MRITVSIAIGLVCASAALTNTRPIPPPVTGQTTTMVKIPDQPEEGRGGYGGKDFEKRKTRVENTVRNVNNRSTVHQSMMMGEQLGECDDDAPD